MTKIKIHPDGPVFDCREGDTILRAALRAGLGMPYSCNVGSCGNCRFELLDGEVLHQRTDAPAWSERDLKRNRWLGCQAAPKSDCTIKFRQDPSTVCRDRPEIRTAELVSITPVTRDINEFTFRIPAQDGFRPGQYALITPPDVEGGRAYSMANLAGDGTWSFMIKRVPGGAATGCLFEQATPGDEMTIDGPYGTAWLRADSERDIVLAAGGSGLSPMVSIARGALAQGMLDNQTLHFFYGARTSSDLFDPEAVLGKELAGKIRFTAALSEAETGWSGPSGLLPNVIAQTMGPALCEQELYFAGPPAMSAAIQKTAYEAGLQMDRMHFDEFF
ncbi:2Fe-2S iron-sulfur cluster-binding protein [Roseibium marinum]|uniref:Toluene monooxygenase electron transfer component n=1 Tax=Roseibium marinum TaxID=281252 RepID=A0A2S3V3F0_9HYPH|nr:2Fe-2S iron-sulfur cluster binding domain-containing protein [Roseibium marinum]POF34517.1 toluene monooxygenase electron transfer component [Roseibium marinum]